MFVVLTCFIFFFFNLFALRSLCSWYAVKSPDKFWDPESQDLRQTHPEHARLRETVRAPNWRRRYCYWSHPLARDRRYHEADSLPEPQAERGRETLQHCRERMFSHSLGDSEVWEIPLWKTLHPRNWPPTSEESPEKPFKCQTHEVDSAAAALLLHSTVHSGKGEPWSGLPQ